MATTLHAGRWTIDHRCESPWHYLPVDVPRGTCALRVELQYAKGGGSTLDLGCFGPDGFRGWSGSVRSSFVISADAATPGYLPGEPEPGTWLVAIGLCRVPADGIEFQLIAETTDRTGALAPDPSRPAPPPDPDRPAPRDLPATAGLRWLAGDLHTHTEHSDGVLTVPELARFAASRGLDFLAITDHNTVSHHAEMPGAAKAYRIALLPGQELTVDSGHANAFGEIGWMDFREPPDEWLAETERRAGLLSVNHPYGGPVAWIAPMRRRPPLIEVWHWSWLDPTWTTPLSWWMAWDPAAIPVGGSDWHRPGSDAPPGSPVTWVQCAAAEPAAVLAGLAAGQVAISASRDGPVLLRIDDELVAVGADGAILVDTHGPRARIRGDLARFSAKPGYHRLTDPAGATLSLTG